MNPEIAFAGAVEQAQLLAEGALTAPALVDTYLERIARLDPVLRAYRVVLADSARADAAAAQRRLDAGERLPLLGVPIAIKDDVDLVRAFRHQAATRPRAVGPTRQCMAWAVGQRPDRSHRRRRSAVSRPDHHDARALRWIRVGGGARTRPVPNRVEHQGSPDAGVLLRELGHDVVDRDRDPDYPPTLTAANLMPRYWRGVHDDVATMPHPERLEARTRRIARLGGLFSDRQIAAARAAEDGIRARMLSIFDDVDVLVTSGATTGPSRIGAYQRRGGGRDIVARQCAGAVPAVFNVTGQPAAVVPWALDRHGVPLSIQLVGRPDDEATLLALSAQIESARPWAGRRPPVS